MAGASEIISQKTRIHLEKVNLPAYKRRRRKRQIAFVGLAIITFAPDGLMSLKLVPFIPFAYYFVPLATAWLIADWLWERPESRQLREWEKKRRDELSNANQSGTPSATN